MEVISAVDIQNGDCVQLIQGAQERLRIPDPISEVEKLADSFDRIHVIDLDRALETGDNLQTIKQILKCDARIQVGGGIRSTRDIEDLLDAGADKVVCGTKALNNSRWLSKAVHLYGDDMIVSVDARNGKVAKNGWQKQTDLEIDHVIKNMLNLGVSSILFTDIERDGTLRGPNLITCTRLANQFQGNDAELLVSGGIRGDSDIKNLSRIQGIGGAVVGTSLYI